RYLYLPSFGLCAMAADLAVAYALGSERRAIVACCGAAAFVVASFAAILMIEPYWRDETAACKRCVEQAPLVAYCHDGLAMALMRDGDLAGARREAQRAIELDPQEGLNLHDLAVIDENRGDMQSAARELTAALKLIDKPAANLYTELALDDDAIGDTVGTEEALRRAQTIPDSANIATLTRAQILFRHGNAKHAEIVLRELLWRAPNYVVALRTLGAILSSQHRYGEALTIYRQAESLSPSDPALHYLQAIALHRIGRDGEARSQCALALAVVPRDQKALRLMTEIDRANSAKEPE
ncbi:MAG TPA: tetratricopeptide repeat protein, partial [Candidatus Binataceae bacterium]|nr:tetratricopeptide repeat protein [Candidatus Binataceae bacterium]